MATNIIPKITMAPNTTTFLLDKTLKKRCVSLTRGEIFGIIVSVVGFARMINTPYL
jgi:hypothetical protein